MITQHEIDLIVEKCKNLPITPDWLQNDYITNLFLTVLEIRLKTVIVERAMNYYKIHRWNEIRTHSDLKSLFLKYPDDKQCNTLISQYLWDYKYWNKVSLLRKLATYFESIGVTSQESLVHWAKQSDFKSDFEGKISGLSFAAYQWLIMRQGMETIKPDIHIRRFVRSVIHRDLSDFELVAALENVAKRLDLKAYKLDWRIWDYQRKQGTYGYYQAHEPNQKISNVDSIRNTKMSNLEEGWKETTYGDIKGVFSNREFKNKNNEPYFVNLPTSLEDAKNTVQICHYLFKRPEGASIMEVAGVCRRLERNCAVADDEKYITNHLVFLRERGHTVLVKDGKNRVKRFKVVFN